MTRACFLLLGLTLSCTAAWSETAWRPASSGSAPTSSRRTTPAIRLEAPRPQPTQPQAAETLEFSDLGVFQRAAALQHTTYRSGADGSLLPVSGFGSSGVSGEEQYNCGVIVDGPPGASGPSFWDRLMGRGPGCDAPTGGSHPWFAPGAGGHPWLGGQPSSGPSWSPFASSMNFRSDHEFDYFISPVTNPFYFEDPRSLTEFRPIVVWGKTPGDSNLTYGGDAVLFNFQGRWAINERWSLVIHRLGFGYLSVKDAPPGLPASPVEGGTSIMNIQLGPKFTFWRDMQTGTVAAIGANFDIPVGSSKILHGGDGGVTPYISAAQRLGDFNLMGSTGYRFGFGSATADFLFLSGHLDYNIANKFFPLVEMNWYRYTANGNRFNSTYEGADMFNAGANAVKGENLLTIALGARYKFSESFQAGAAYEIPVVGRDNFFRWRLTFDLIFRY